MTSRVSTDGASGCRGAGAGTKDTRNNSDAKERYFAMAHAGWFWDASAPVSVAGGVFTWNSAEATGVSAPAAWAPAQGERPKIDGKAFNTEVMNTADHWPDL